MPTLFTSVAELTEHIRGKTRAEVIRLCKSERRAAGMAARKTSGPSRIREQLEQYEQDLWFLMEFIKHDRLLWLLFPNTAAFGEIAKAVRSQLDAEALADSIKEFIQNSEDVRAALPPGKLMLVGNYTDGRESDINHRQISRSEFPLRTRVPSKVRRAGCTLSPQ
jgi:hypothetical protein